LRSPRIDWQEEILGDGLESFPKKSAQRGFFDYAGPLFSVVISPAASTVALGDSRKFRALPRDRSRRRVTEDLTFAWQLIEGQGELRSLTDQEIEYRAPTIQGLARLK
jgi:hypothetical protein